MKIDAQGSELDILRNARKTLKNIDVVEVEAWFTKKYKGQPRIEQIHKLMSSNGFNFLVFLLFILVILNKKHKLE